MSTQNSNSVILKLYPNDLPNASRHVTFSGSVQFAGLGSSNFRQFQAPCLESLFAWSDFSQKLGTQMMETCWWFSHISRIT
jgi:hypothetical protein